MSYSGPIVVGVDGHVVQQDVVGQLSVEQLFNVQVENASDDKSTDEATALMQTSAAQHAQTDKGTSDIVHDDDSTNVPTLAGVPTGRQLLAVDVVPCFHEHDVLVSFFGWELADSAVLQREQGLDRRLDCGRHCRCFLI